MTMHEPSVLEINLSAIDRNLATIRRGVGPHCRLCPIVKADAYGMGAARIARRMATAGADLLAVYSLPQAAELGAAGVALPVLVLMPVREVRPGEEAARMLLAGRLHLTIHDAAQIESLGAVAERLGVRVPVHLEIDTGLSRGGVRADEAGALLARLLDDGRFVVAGVFTHFVDSRTDAAATDEQTRRFDATIAPFLGRLPDACAIHLASTYALLRHPRYHRSMVRFGLAWAGFGEEELSDGFDWQGGGLEPCLRWRSRVVQVKRLAPGATVGYGATWTARRPSLVGLVPVGYADGFPVFRGDRETPVRVAVLRETPRGAVREYAPVIGAVNMDQITIDLTDVDPLGAAAGPEIGWSVEIVSADAEAPNHLPRLARRAGMIPHEMLCRIHPRIPRLYVVDEAASEQSPESRPAVVAEPRRASQAG